MSGHTARGINDRGLDMRYKTIQVYTKRSQCIQYIYRYQVQDLSQYKSFMGYKTGSLQTMG